MKRRVLTLTLYPGMYEIGARSFSSEARLSSLPGKLQQLYRYDDDRAVRSQFDVELSSTGAVMVAPFTFDATVLEKETETELVEIVMECIDTQGGASDLCPDMTRNAPPRVKQWDLRQEIEYYDISVTINSPTTFTIVSLSLPNADTGVHQYYKGSGTMSYDENGDETITAITLNPSDT